VQFLYYKTVQLLYCHSAVPILKTVQLLYCYRAVPIPQNRPVTVLSQGSSYTTKRSSYCIVTGQFLYHKTAQLLYCHSAVPIPQNGPVTVLSQYSSYTTKPPSYCIVTVQFLYYKTVQLLYCHSAIRILQNGPVTVLSQCNSYTSAQAISPPFPMHGPPHISSHRCCSKSIEILKFIYGKHPLCCVTISRFNIVDRTTCHVLYSL